jgi:hypothetical protein
MERMKALSIFIAGMIVGGAAGYLSPSQGGGAMPMGFEDPKVLPPGDAGQPPADGTVPGLLPGSPPLGTPPAGMEPAPPPPGEGNVAPPADFASARPEQRLQSHLRGPSAAWGVMLERTREGDAKALSSEVQAHIASIPVVNDRMPPLPEVASYLAQSSILVQKLAARGLDVTALQDELTAVMERPGAGAQPVPAAPPTP